MMIKNSNSSSVVWISSHSSSHRRTPLTCAWRDATRRRACQRAKNTQRPPRGAASRTEPAPVTRGSSAPGRARWRGAPCSGICTAPSRNSPTTAAQRAADPSPRRSSTAGPADRRRPARPARRTVRRGGRASGKRSTRAGRETAGPPHAPLWCTPTAPGGQARPSLHAPWRVRSSRLASRHQDRLHHQLSEEKCSFSF